MPIRTLRLRGSQLKDKTTPESDDTTAPAPPLPLEMCLSIYQYIPSTTDRFRLACTNRSFSDAARLASAWPDLNVRCVGVKLSRSGRKILPSEDLFLEELRLFLRQRRFNQVKHLDASFCHLGEPVALISLLVSCLPALNVVNLSHCGPDFHWAFLRWDRIPPHVHSALLLHPALTTLVYGSVVWVRVDHKFVKFSRC